ncbi:MAG: hypothetical protein DRJ56_02405 [Thermoprotei archaeon]|nr:MAG: hypothetical protein DRJ56_02405 [Thermoprotei archaeon]
MGDVIPRYLYFVYLAAYLVSLVIGILALTGIAPLASVYGTCSSVFAHLVLAYILYLALSEVAGHRAWLIGLVRGLDEAVGRSGNEGVRALSLTTGRLRSEASRLPARAKPAIFAAVIASTNLAGIALVLWASSGVVRAAATFPPNVEELMLYAAVSLAGSALLIVCLVFTVYALHVVNGDLFRAEGIEEELLVAVRGLADRLGLEPVSAERGFRVSKRSTALYVVLTIVTLGYFMLYWVYAAVFKDLNGHLAEDERLKPAISGVLERLQAAQS